MRTTLAAACAAAALLAPLGTAPAAATTAGTMNCTFSYNPWSGNRAVCTFTGVLADTAYVGALVTFPFEVGHTICPFSQGSAGWFAWERYGTAGLATFDGADTPNGVMTFSSPCPPSSGSETVTITFGAP